MFRGESCLDGEWFRVNDWINFVVFIFIQDSDFVSKTRGNGN